MLDVLSCLSCDVDALFFDRLVLIQTCRRRLLKSMNVTTLLLQNHFEMLEDYFVLLHNDVLFDDDVVDIGLVVVDDDDQEKYFQNFYRLVLFVDRRLIQYRTWQIP